MDNDMDHSGQAGSGMDGMMGDADLKDLEEANGADASRLYLEGMVKHHKGAVVMAKTEIDSGTNPDAIALAEQIEAAQTAEIAEMEALLAP